MFIAMKVAEEIHFFRRLCVKGTSLLLMRLFAFRARS